jgi:hypothetical protein
MVVTVGEPSGASDAIGGRSAHDDLVDVNLRREDPSMSDTDVEALEVDDLDGVDRRDDRR